MIKGVGGFGVLQAFFSKFRQFPAKRVTLVGDEGPPHSQKRLSESRRVSLSASLGESPAQPY